MSENHKIRVLVAATAYPDLTGSLKCMYIHTRDIYYKSQEIDVTVLNFSASESYVIDGIPVICLNFYETYDGQYDVLICHAANLRNHYKFLKKYESRFRKIIFFFHGHEVLHINKVYPKPYRYMKESLIKRVGRDVYDGFKLIVWRKYFQKILNKSYFVFVSKWMMEEFLSSVGLTLEMIKNRYSITYNCIGNEFESNKYDYDSEKSYDFITVRGNLDGSKYCVDLVNELAKSNPGMKFLLVGKGEFFNHYEKAINLDWINETMNHDKIIDSLQKTRCALMPTRADAQGVMACEMASIGMPLITSDLPICHEIFDSFENVSYIRNEDMSTDLGQILGRLESGMPYCRSTRYYMEHTGAREVKIIRKLFNES